jgi:hypothetical protein
MESPSAELAITCRREPVSLSERDITVLVVERATLASPSTVNTVIVERNLAGGLDL